jgi:hypothetical protein
MDEGECEKNNYNLYHEKLKSRYYFTAEIAESAELITGST